MEEKEALTILSSPAIAYERLCDSIILPQSLDLKNASSVTRMCSDILCEYQKPSFSSLVYRIKLINLLLELSGECFNEDQPFQKSGGTPSIVRQLIVMMEDELSNADASVKFFADRMNVNADYLGASSRTRCIFRSGSILQEEGLNLPVQDYAKVPTELMIFLSSAVLVHAVSSMKNFRALQERHRAFTAMNVPLWELILCRKSLLFG